MLIIVLLLLYLYIYSCSCNTEQALQFSCFIKMFSLRQCFLCLLNAKLGG